MAVIVKDLQFCRARMAHSRARRITPSLTENRSCLQELRRDGIAVVSGFISQETVDVIVQEIWDNTDLMTDALGSDIVHRNARLILQNPEKHAPSTAAVFQDHRLRDLAKAYLSPIAVPDRPAIQLKRGIGETSAVDFYHIDEWRPLMSIFVYLSHVGADNAPMQYLKGSHKWRPWRFRREQDFFAYYGRGADGGYVNEESPYAGCLLPTDVRRLRERYGWPVISCEGEAGTMVVFDNLGLHRATPLAAGSRLLLSSYWQLPRE